MFVVRPVPIRHRRLAPLDPDERRRHKQRNLLHALLLLGGMVALLALCGFVVFGPDGVVLVPVLAAVTLLFAPQASPRLVLQMYRARELHLHEAPDLMRVLDELARRADLPARPDLFLIPSPMLNAFAVGNRNAAAITLTDGLLRALTFRELVAVLAHEISHVRNNDLWLMGLADLIGRLTRLMTLTGFVLIVLFLPLWLTGAAAVPWLLLPLLVFAPQLTVLMQLALSRTREFDADLDAVGLTGDVEGLVLALRKLAGQRGLWEQILMPGYRLPEPSALRTHPPTEERVARLRALTGVLEERADLPSHWRQQAPVACPWPPAVSAPRHRLIRPWH